MKFKHNRSSVRLIQNKMVMAIVWMFAALAFFPVASLLLKVLKEGLRVLDINILIMEQPAPLDVMFASLSGEPIQGGIVNGIFGSFYMLFLAILMAVPLGFFAGFYLSENTHRYATIVRYFNNMIMRIPSILIGLVVYILVVRTMRSYSALAGSIALTVVMFPRIAVATYKQITAIPLLLKEGAYSLGISKINIYFKVFIPMIWRGQVSVIFRETARAIGETAPLIFTALGSGLINWDLDKPTSSLSLLIWRFFNDPYMTGFLWVTALFLLATILILKLIAGFFDDETLIDEENE